METTGISSKMLYYIYDGTFPGLMTAVFYAKYHKEIPVNFLTENSERYDLFGEYVTINTDKTRADRVIDAIINKISKNALNNVIYCFLSESENCGKLIYSYLEAGWEKGLYVDHYLTDSSVLELHKLARKVKLECHRMLGLVRFELVENDIYYAKIEPDHNIAGLISSHFAKRLPDQRWIIHDIKRGVAARYDQKDWDIINIEINYNPEIENKEKFYQSLWREYFKKIAIPERKNEKLQKQCMPKRYWKHLVEMNK